MSLLRHQRCRLVGAGEVTAVDVAEGRDGRWRATRLWPSSGPPRTRCASCACR